MKQEMHDKSTAGGENTGEIQFAVFYLAEKGAQSVKTCYGPSYTVDSCQPRVSEITKFKKDIFGDQHPDPRSRVCPPAPELSCFVRRGLHASRPRNECHYGHARIG